MFSVQGMTITMLDSAAGMRAMLHSSPGQWPEAARRLWEPMAGMYFFIPGGPDMAAVHGQNFGFGSGAPRQEMVDALHRLEQADAWGRIEQSLTQGTQDLGTACPGATIPDLTVLLVLGDPTNRHFVDEIRGLSAFGGISGYIAITVWPTDEVVDRLEDCLHHRDDDELGYSRPAIKVHGLPGSSVDEQHLDLSSVPGVDGPGSVDNRQSAPRGQA